MSGDRPNSEIPIEDSISHAEKELDRLLGWVRAAEPRLALVISMSTAMLGALAVFAPRATEWTFFGITSTVLSVLPLLLSLIFSGVATFPRTQGPGGSLIFFGGIAKCELGDYKDQMKALTPERHLNDLLNQCHRNAEIATKKYFWAQAAMICLFVAAIPWLMALYNLYLENNYGPD